MKTIFLRMLDLQDKPGSLLALIRKPGEGTRDRRRFEMDSAAFSAVPGSPFAYWVSERIRRLFTELPPFEARRGLGTDDDFRFLRRWVEVTPGHKTWLPLTKGGAASTFYSDLDLVVNWEHNGAELRALVAQRWGNEGKRIYNEEYYLRPGLTWPPRTQSGLGLRAMPSGCIMGSKGPALFVTEDGFGLMPLLAIATSAVFRSLVEMQMAFGSYEVGVIQRTPVPNTTAADKAVLGSLANRAWSLKRFLDTCSETSHAFTLPALLQVPGDTLAARATAWAERVRVVEAELSTIQAEIDARAFDLYGIDDADRRAITSGFGAVDESAPVEPEFDDEADVEDAEAALADAASLTAELLSWTAGVACGRFDVRLATGERSAPTEPGPFDPLPVSSAGMLTGGDGLPLTAAPPGYPLAFPADGVLVDDPGHPRDLAAAVRSVFDVVFGTEAHARWQEAAELLEPKGLDLRGWLARSLFEHHIKRYSKSRRKAPILWQLATSSGSYSIWLYAHRLTKDIFFNLQNDVVASKLVHEERKHASLVQEAGPNPTASQRKALAALESFLDELRAFRDEVARVAPLWNPDLNDGILLTAAPLWRLFPHHRAWQRELRTAWESLSAGEYDWAHLAMHLWPERVVPKCATDRSLAIAHNLEGVFWAENVAGKWQARSTPLQPIDELVRERDSSAVKAVLRGIIEAPERPRPTRGSRSRKAEHHA